MALKTASRKAVLALAIVAALGFCLAPAAHAKEGPLYARSKTAKMTRKLCRGIGNTLFFWAEVPKNIFQKSYDTDVFTGIIWGTGAGVERGLQRLGYGLWETVTFYSPAHRNYQPYIEPEFVLMSLQD